MGMFAKKTAEADPQERGGLWFEPGKYPLVQVDQLKLVDSTKDEGIEKFVIVCDILQSNVAERPAGMTGVAQVMSGKYKGSFDDAKRFLIACFPDVDPAEWDKPHALDKDHENSVVNAAQPGHGRLLELEAWHKKNPKNGNIYTVHKWSPVAPDIQAAAAELRAAAGLKPF